MGYGFSILDSSFSIVLLQRTEIVDDASWIMGFLDIIDPAVDSIKRLLNIEKDKSYSNDGVGNEQFDADSVDGSGSGFDLDEFVRQKLLLDPSNLEVQFTSSSWSKSNVSGSNVRRSGSKNGVGTSKE